MLHEVPPISNSLFKVTKEMIRYVLIKACLVEIIRSQNSIETIKGGDPKKDRKKKLRYIPGT